jgi:hypothetical protein
MSTIGTLFEINGVISTDKSVMQNINTLCTSAGAWMTYDIAEGRWSVVINRAGASISSFNDSNIIGGINISGTGVNELYNSATIEYPHKDLRDQTDYIDLEIPSADRFPYELDNRLNIKLDCINNPVTAQYLASVELKQSRVDKVIQFRTDYSKIGLKAGDIIDVTNSVYGYTAKKFRITKVEEEDTEGLAISITALEYDEAVYSTDGLIRKIREKKTGIIPKDNNDNLSGNDNLATANGISFAFQSVISTGAIQSAYNAYAGLTPFGGSGVPPEGFSGNQTTYAEVGFNLTKAFRSVTFFCQTPVGLFDFFRKTGGSVVLKEAFYAFIPSKYKVYKNGVLLGENTSDWQTQSCVFPLYNLTAGNYTVRITPLLTYDLSQETNVEIWPRNYVIAPQTSGGGFTVTGLAIL